MCSSDLKNPNDMYARFHLATAEAALGNTERAALLFQQVARALPEYPQVYFELGQLETGRGAAGKGIFYLGKYYLFQGREELAVQNLKRASRDRSLPETMRKEAGQILAGIDKIKKGT